ncbi:MAG: hypothetical protein CMG55_07380 [Candidatus Marinimicrobia bacterium]|nr:hypothetical protein [Candidatus Neomarinimicrobiota bacterium]|tara:strand:+ start:225 stop:950 length:726 start_codon:yes stop_codon:yes gene_type:complete
MLIITLKMRKYIVLLLITGTVWAQTDFDKLVYKDGRAILGEFSEIIRTKAYFKAKGRFAVYRVPINRIQTLELKDGTIIINDGKIMENDGEVIEIGSAEYLDLTIEQNAFYDAKKDAQKWLAYPILAVLSSGGLATTTFFFGEDILGIPDETMLFTSIFGGSLGLVGSYRLFSKLDKRNLEVISTEDIELYKKMYSKEFKKRKLKNIIISSSLLGLATVVGVHFAFRDFMTDYDVCFDPRC